MTQLSAHLATPHPATTLCAYAESIVRGRRVVVFGDALLGLGEGLIDRGARLVHVYDPDPARVAIAAARSATTKGMHPLYAALDGDLGVRDGAFDVVVVPDLSVLVNPGEIVRRARRLLPPNGVALFAAPNPDAERWLLPPPASIGDAPGYYELYDMVALQFTEVKMLGQAPFVGYALVDFSAEDPEVSVDTSLLAQPEVPEWYVAVASERRSDLDAYALIEIPLADVARAAVAPEPRTLPRGREEKAAHEAALQEAETRIVMLLAENERLNMETAARSSRDETRNRSQDVLSMRVAELEKELNDARGRSLEAEGRAAEANLRASQSSVQARDLDEEVQRQRDRCARLAKQLEEEKKSRQRVEEEARALRTRSTPAPPAPPVFPAPPAPHVPRASHGSTPPPPLDVADARERAEARDRALSLLSELATRDARIAELEEALDKATDPPTLRSMHNAQAARIVELERQAAELDRQLAEIRALGAVADEHAKARQEALDAEQKIREQASVADSKARQEALEAARADVEMARRAVDVQRRELESLHAKLEESRAEVAALIRELDAAKALIPALQTELSSRPDESTLTADHAKELDALEAALRERGHAISQLERDMRESERIGRELIAENEALRTKLDGGSNGSSGSGQASNSQNGVEPKSAQPSGGLLGKSPSIFGESELSELSERSARAQADLASAAWRIAQLERELSVRPKDLRPPSERQRELEEALVHAHRELADLRIRLDGQAAERVDPLSATFPIVSAPNTEDRAP